MIRRCGSVGETAAPHGFGVALPFVTKAAVKVYGDYPADSHMQRHGSSCLTVLMQLLTELVTK